jgi:trimethylamine:corrinoid methyltransferase-like protein
MPRWTGSASGEPRARQPAATAARAGRAAQRARRSDAYTHGTFKPAFSAIWEDIAVLFQKDVLLVQYDVLAVLRERGTRILLPKRRVRGVELGQPACCGNHIHSMRMTDAPSRCSRWSVA